MKASSRILLTGLLCLLLGLLGWWYYRNTEEAWVALPQYNAERQKHPMLAAQRWLQSHHYQAALHPTLNDLALHKLPAGTLLIAHDGGLITPPQAQQIQRWVRQGNTLIVRPLSAADPAPADCQARHLRAPAPDTAPEEPASVIRNPITHTLGVEAAWRQEADNAQQPPCKTQIHTGQPAEPAYPLQVDVQEHVLVSTSAQAAPFAAGDGAAVRIYHDGPGHIVVLADDYFNNNNLEHDDNAELLLRLLQLTPASRQVFIIENANTSHWTGLLWQHAHYALIAALLFIAAAVWRGMRRFGAPLPDPSEERRSLMEHIEASGRWLWHTPAGPDALLSAARQTTLKALHRRIPQFARLAPAEQTTLLATRTGLPAALIEQALWRAAARQPATFTQQIQTLKQLQQHHE